jgi:hypothetical protein
MAIVGEFIVAQLSRNFLLLVEPKFINLFIKIHNLASWIQSIPSILTRSFFELSQLKFCVHFLSLTCVIPFSTISSFLTD